MLAQSKNIQSPAPRKYSNVLSFILGSCVGMLVSCVGTAGLFIAFALSVSQHPAGLQVTHDLPCQARVNENFDLTLKITNRSESDLFVGNIGLAEMFMPSLLEGMVVTGTEPQMNKDYSVEGVKLYYFNDTVGPGETRTVIFHLQAKTAGKFGGPVGVYNGMRSMQVFPTITISE